LLACNGEESGICTGLDTATAEERETEPISSAIAEIIAALLPAAAEMLFKF